MATIERQVYQNIKAALQSYQGPHGSVQAYNDSDIAESAWRECGGEGPAPDWVFELVLEIEELLWGQL